jgi:hypothetical protein
MTTLFVEDGLNLPDFVHLIKQREIRALPFDFGED